MEGLASQSLPASNQQQSLDTVVVGQPVSCIVDLDVSTGNACAEKQQTVVDSSVMLVEPTDFLLSSIQPLNVLSSDERPETMTADDVKVSSMLLDADLVKGN